MDGKVLHFEIPVDDSERANAFYGGVFGWQLVPMPEMGYTMVSTGPTNMETGPEEPGFINGGMFKRDDAARATNVVIGVASIGEALTQVEAAGGKTVTERFAVGEMGFTAYFTDTEGNLVGLWENAAE